MDQLHKKYDSLKKLIKSWGSVAVAFSGGVDSCFLMKVAADVLGDKAIAITADTAFIPRRENGQAREFCAEFGIRQEICHMDVFSEEGLCENPKDRCYICKKGLFSRIQDMAQAAGCSVLCDGTNKDDEGDFRPGMKALEELGIRSPLRECGLTKQDIRDLSKELGLPNWNHPSYACLASRFPYGQEITEADLRRVEQAEDVLLELGFPKMRVRIHGNLARIEVPEQDFDDLMHPFHRSQILGALKELGFTYVTLDLQGFRSGSMNEVL